MKLAYGSSVRMDSDSDSDLRKLNPDSIQGKKGGFGSGFKSGFKFCLLIATLIKSLSFKILYPWIWIRI